MPPRRPPSAVTTSTISGWMSRLLAHHLGLHEVLEDQVGGEHDHEHDERLGDPAVAEGDDHGQAAAEEGADVGDVAADEVDHHDGEHEREAEQEAARPMTTDTMADMTVRPFP